MGKQNWHSVFTCYVKNLSFIVRGDPFFINVVDLFERHNDGFLGRRMVSVQSDKNGLIVIQNVSAAKLCADKIFTDGADHGHIAVNDISGGNVDQKSHRHLFEILAADALLVDVALSDKIVKPIIFQVITKFFAVEAFI